MATQVSAGAILQCSFGAAPSTLSVIPSGTLINATGSLAATIMDYTPITNISPFGVCSSPANPTVAAATAAAAGTLTPMPCIPNIPASWIPGSPKILINNIPALTDDSQCMCVWAGIISVTAPGQAKVQFS